VRRAVVALALLIACGGDEPETFDGPWDVVLVVGSASADPAADASAFPGVGSDATETWTFACDGEGCVLSRAAGGFLGGLDGVRLEVVGDTARAEVAGVRPVPAPEEPSPCAGTPAETWTVQIEVSLDDETFVGSVIRIPDALVADDCFGLDLTLGVSGSRRE
jgi:hypothetical protein